MNASEVERRSFFADRLADYFRKHPLVWISIMDLIKIGGPSWRSRIACDLRPRGMCVLWNKNNKASAYMYRPEPPLARDASEPVAALPLFPGDGPWSQP